jgi:hypothetical protein
LSWLKSRSFEPVIFLGSTSLIICPNANTGIMVTRSNDGLSSSINAQAALSLRVLEAVYLVKGWASLPSLSTALMALSFQLSYITQ